MKTMLKQTHFSARDFSVKTRNGLSRKGIEIIGIRYLPGEGGDYLNGFRGYELSHNGTYMIRTYLEVKAMAL